MQFSPEVLFSPLLRLSSMRLGEGRRADEHVFTDAENAFSRPHSHRGRGGMRRIHSHEDQLLSLWTLGCGGPSQELSSLVSYAGA